MDIIVNHKRTKVLFDKKNNIYIKKFFPKLEARIKYLLGFRRYPGKNFQYIAVELSKLGINVPEIIHTSKYSITTKKIEGVLLRDYLKKDTHLTKEFLDLIVTVLKNGIYFGDFNTGNFIVSDGKIYALDLEDYKKEFFLKRGKKEALRRLRRTLKNDTWVSYIENELKKEKPLSGITFKKPSHIFLES